MQEDMESGEGFEVQREKKSGFGRGVLIGAAGTLLAGAVALFAFLSVFGEGSVFFGQKESLSIALSDQVKSKVNELIGYIHLYFYDDVEEEQLAEGIYSGLLSGLDDKYTQYYTAQEYADLQIFATQNYCGIGAGLSQDRDTMQVTVTHVYDGSPAQKAGILDGDVLVMVEGIESVSMELSDLVTHIRGEEGTKVHLQIYREGEEDYLEIDVERANIDLPTVSHKLLDGEIGYIQILEFGAPTAEQFAAAVEDLTAQGMRAMILDVRDNPGGMVTAVTEILDSILPEGVVVYTQDKYGKRQDYTSDEKTKMDLPIAVLMNGNSASAAEILAGAIRDFQYGTLIGEKTFGKGVVQSIITLKEGDAIKLTTAKYFTPNGENIHGTGIAPDVELPYEYMGKKSGEYDEMKDNQVLRAIEILKKEL